MTNPGSITNQAPRGTEDIYRRLRDLERQVTELTAARTLENAVIGANGLVVSADGGITVRDQSSNRKVVYMGHAETIDGADQMVLMVYRDDGSTALAMGDLGLLPGHPHQQALQWYDRAGRVVLADDTNGGVGLAAPHLHGTSGPVANTNVSTWPGTTNAAFTTIAAGYWEWQNPRLTWQVWLQADAGTTAQFQVIIGGQQASTTQTVIGAFATWSAPKVPLPAGVAIGDTTYCELTARVTAGSGSARAIVQRWAGDQS